MLGPGVCVILVFGGVADWIKAAVLKTAVPHGTGGSNPSPSATGRGPGCQYALSRDLLSARNSLA